MPRRFNHRRQRLSIRPYEATISWDFAGHYDPAWTHEVKRLGHGHRAYSLVGILYFTQEI